MKKIYSSIEELIKKNLSTKEVDKTLELIHKLKNVKKRGYFTKEEFVEMCMWKSPRPKNQYLKNSEKDIILISEKVFSTKFEKGKIELLTSLNGISIPTASAILTLTDPKNYGVIDIRVWQIFYLYGSVKVKPKGTNFDFKNWYNYLMKLKYYAKKFNVSPRDIERTLFFYHKNNQQGELYNKVKQNLVIKNIEKIRKVSLTLFKDYSEKKGIFKQFSFPPEYILPNNMKRGSEEHLLFLTLTVSLDYMRDAEKLWKQSRDLCLNHETNWIFNPKTVINKGLDSLTKLFKNINDQRPTKDAKIWFAICKKLLEFDGSIYKLLEHIKFDALSISQYLDDSKDDFPYLSGYKIKPLWIRMIDDTANIKLKRIDEIPIPVNVHTARMTLKIIFNENFDGKITNELRKRTQNVWKTILNGTHIYPLQIDEPLWLMGKYKLLEKFMNEYNYHNIKEK